MAADLLLDMVEVALLTINLDHIAFVCQSTPSSNPSMSSFDHIFKVDVLCSTMSIVLYEQQNMVARSTFHC